MMKRKKEVQTLQIIFYFYTTKYVNISSLFLAIKFLLYLLKRFGFRKRRSAERRTFASVLTTLFSSLPRYTSHPTRTVSSKLHYLELNV